VEPDPATQHRKGVGVELAHLPHLVLAISVVGLLALFADKAFSIDDPLFLWLAHHIADHPLDPYGFSVNWFGELKPMIHESQNPPLAGYYLAAAGKLFGWSERALHAALIPPAAAVVATTAALARRLGVSPIEAGFAAALTPAFLVTATNVSSDMLLLAFWCGSVLCWMRGLDGDRRRWLVAAAALAGLAVLTKYFGVALVPLLFVYALVRKRRLGVWVWPLAIPLLVLAAFDRTTSHMYDVGLFIDAARYAGDYSESAAVSPKTVLVALAFAGGSVASVLAYAPLLWSRRVLLVALVLLSAVVALSPWLLPPLGIRLGDAATGGPWISAQLWAMALGGFALIALCISDLRRRGGADAVLLAAWVLGTFVFAGFVNWTTNGRAILPMVPAVAILLLRRLQDVGGGSPVSRAAALAACAAVALSVTWADYHWANEVRAAARRLSESRARPDAPAYFQGHWGFQYYMEQEGWSAMVWQRDVVKPGELIAASSNNYGVPIFHQGPKDVVLIEKHASPEPRWLHTMSTSVDASFYSSSRGSLPFSIGKSRPDRYQVWRAKKFLRFTGPHRTATWASPRDAEVTR
jgi:4-amino-4-deoxy-L-arabinose transferase-like glycosyltransferase